MDATQTSDPTGVGPGTPGQASAFRRTLDDQALHAEVETEGPLDLTVPLNFAEIRAALSSSGSNRRPPPPEVLAIPAVHSARRGGGGRRRGAVHAAAPGHIGSKRLGRIGVFVALATALSMGTAAALVFSSGGQGASVSLPTTNGNIPVATAPAAGGGNTPITAPTPSAPRTVSSTAPGAATTASAAAFVAPATSASASATASTSATATASGSPSATATTAATATASAAASGSQSPGTPSPTGSPFATLQQGSSGTEVSDVQQMLVEIDLLMQQHDRRRIVFVDVEDYALADPSGSYGQATATAVAAFQQTYDVGGDPGVCDQATFDALTAQTAVGDGVAD